MVSFVLAALPAAALLDVVQQSEENSVTQAMGATKALPDPFEREAREFVAAMGGTPMAAPPAQARSEEESRAVWSQWVRRSLAAPDGGLQAHSLLARMDQGEEGTGGSGISTSKGLRTVWSFDAYGGPREILSAGKDGAFFLSTSAGVLRIPGPNQEPDWVAKTDGWVYRSATADANKDGILDVVLTIEAYYYDRRGGPSLYVLNGLTGEVLFSGFAGDDALRTWTLTDVDGDGAPEVLGLTINSELVAAGLDGAVRHRTPLEPLLPSEGHRCQPPPMSCSVHMYSSPAEDGVFADVDGNGVADIVIPQTTYVSAGSFNGMPFAMADVWVEALVVRAHSGVDGSRIWETAPEPLADAYTHWRLLVGDMNGDGRDDPLLRMGSWNRAYATTEDSDAWTTFSRYGTVAYSGSDGTVLFRDLDQDFSLDPGEVEYALSEAETHVWLVMDLDRDGRDDLVAVEYEFPGAGGDEGDAMQPTGQPEGPVDVRVNIIGRSAPSTPAEIAEGTSVPTYRQGIDLKGYLELETDIAARDVDGDGQEELAVLILGFKGDEEGHATSIDSLLGTAAPTKLDLKPTSALTAFWDYDPQSKQGYGWLVDSDRLVPMAPTGAATGDGISYVPFILPLLTHDHNGDGTQDLLLARIGSVAWHDGRTGRALDSYDRPLLREPEGAYVENNRVRLLEDDGSTGEQVLVDLATQAELWRVTEEITQDSWVQDVADVTADGWLDLVLRGWGDQNDRTYDMRSKRVAWEGTKDVDGVRVADLVSSRPGKELLLRVREEGQIKLAVKAPEREGFEWQTPLMKDVGSASAEAGLVWYNVHGEKPKTVVLDGESGKQIFSFDKMEGSDWTSIAALRANHDDRMDIVALSLVSVDDKTYKRTVRVWDGATGAELSKFDISPGGDGHGVVYTAPIGDWTGDGTNEIAFHEDDFVVIRDGKSGGILAVPPSRGELVAVVDVDQNGLSDPVVGSEAERLAVYVRDAAAEERPLNRVIEVVEKPQEARFDPEACNCPDKKNTPGAGPLLLLAAAALVVALVRRRRE